MFKGFKYSLNGCGNWAVLASILAILTLASASTLALGTGLIHDKAGDKPAETQKKIELRAVPHPATRSAEQCGQILQSLTTQSDQVIRVRKILKDNLHWRSTAHSIIPSKIAIQSDIDAAYWSLNEDEMPALVSLIGRGELKVAFGVLGKFGAKALPCIEAGLARDRAPGATDLSAIKINIETELRSPPGPP